MSNSTNVTTMATTTTADATNTARYEYVAYTAAITVFGALSATLCMAGIVMSADRIWRNKSRKALASSTGASDELRQLKHYERRQVASAVGLSIRMLAALAIVVVQWDQLSTALPFFLTTGQRIGLGHLLLALVCVSSIRQWMYEPEDGTTTTTTTNTACYKLSIAMVWICPVVSSIAVAWDAIDLASEIIFRRECVTLCSVWFMWTINCAAVLTAIGGWLYVFEQKFEAYRQSPMPYGRDSNIQLAADCVTTCLSFINALMLLMAFACLVAFEWLPERQPRWHVHTSIEFADLAWYWFSLLYIFYLCLDSTVLLIGQLDKAPVMKYADGHTNTTDIHSAALAPERTLTALDHQGAHSAVVPMT